MLYDESFTLKLPMVKGAPTVQGAPLSPSGSAAAFCLPITIRAPTWILAFSSAFFAFFLTAALWHSLSATAAGLLLADAKTECMHPANMQTQNLLHLDHSWCCLVEISGYNDCYCLGGLLFIPWAQTCSKAARRPRFIRRKPWQNVKNVSDLDQNVRNVRDPIRTWRAGRERTGIRGRPRAEP